MIQTKFKFILLLTIICSYSIFSQSKQIILGQDPKVSETLQGKFYALVYQEAFSRIGYTVIFKVYPAKRSMFYANDGTIDGLPGRVKEFNSLYKNLLLVDVPIYSLNFSAFSTNPIISLNGWNSLSQKPYSVAYRIGIKKTEDILPTIIPKSSLFGVERTILGLKMIDTERVDIYIDLEHVVLQHLKEAEFSSTKIKKAGIMETVNIYMFLHNKHKDIISDLEITLNNMKKEGLFDSYWDIVNN